MSNMMRELVKAKAEPGIWMERAPRPTGQRFGIRQARPEICL